jgi:hypothetical protein
MTDRDLYDVARRLCHEQGMPWTDPRTLITYEPPDDQVTDNDIREWCDKTMETELKRVTIIGDGPTRHPVLLKSQRVNIEIVRRLREMLREPKAAAARDTTFDDHPLET